MYGTINTRTLRSRTYGYSLLRMLLARLASPNVARGIGNASIQQSPQRNYKGVVTGMRPNVTMKVWFHRMLKAKRTGTLYNSNNSLIHWTPHSSDSGSCAVCDRFDQQGKGGLPRKEPTTHGRPAPLSPQALRTAVTALGVKSYHSGSPLHPSRCQIPATISTSDVQCPVCDNILETPIQLSCGKIVCGGCIVVQYHTCPGCKGEHANSLESLRAPCIVL